MKRVSSLLIFLSLLWALVSCDNIVYSERVDRQLAELNDSMKVAEQYIRQLQQEPSYEVLRSLAVLDKDLYFNYDADDFDPDKRSGLLAEKLRVDSARTIVEGVLKETLPKVYVPQVKLADHLVDSVEHYSFYASKGDTLHLSAHLSCSSKLTLYNANSRLTLRTYTRQTDVEEVLTVPNSAIYLLKIEPAEGLYADVEVSLQIHDMDALITLKKITEERVEARKGDWLAEAVEGVKMQSLFEEPRKFTLRGQLKAAFSGSSRALVALQVPKGATDVMYSLRISTNESDSYSDGHFKDDMSTSYRKIRFLGLPIYESKSGSGLLATLLGENQPPREEDAYINMYVFFNAAQARKFQDGELTSKLKYHVDYSTIGTQSCNGRIPANGYKTIYLGFENERVRYNNYVWLEAISAVPHTEYFKTQYTIAGEGEE